MINSILFVISFGELDISPVFFVLLLLISIFVFLSVLISTTKLIQTLVKDID